MNCFAPSPLRLTEAWQCIAALPSITDRETVPITAACGRVLCAPLIARDSHPARDIAAMDGYAFAGSHKPQTLRMAGRAEAGDPYSGPPLQAGQCVRIFTGAPLPQGSDAVAAQEVCRVDNQQISVPKTPAATFVRLQGSDVTAGTQLAASATCLHDRDVAVALACDIAEVCVVRPIRLGLLATGSELRAISASAREPSPEHQGTLNANMPAIAAGLLSPATRIRDHGIARDDINALRAAIADTLEADLVILSGGVSVGEKDLVRPVLESLGAEIIFHGLRVKPGKPCLLAQKNNTIILALPGNPVSAMVGTQMIARPVLRQLQGQHPVAPQRWPARCATPLPRGAGRQNLVRGRYQIDDQGQIQAELLENQDSAALHTLARANCLINIDIDAPAREIGDYCAIFAF